MDVVEFAKTANRMCNWAGLDCSNCYFKERAEYCVDDILLTHVPYEELEKAAQAMEEWAKEHPVKTRKSEFLKMFPNARFQKSGELAACPQSFDKTIDCLHTPDCKKCMHDFWNQEV